MIITSSIIIGTLIIGTVGYFLIKNYSNKNKIDLPEIQQKSPQVIKKNDNQKTIIKKTKHFEKLKEELIIINDFIGNVIQQSEKLTKSYFNERTLNELSHSKLILDDINTNLVSASQELKKIKKKEHNKNKEYISKLYSYIDHLLFDIFQKKINKNIPKTPLDKNWEKKIALIKKNINLIKIGCGHLLNSINEFINSSEQNIKNLNEIDQIDENKKINIKKLQDEEPYFTSAPSTKTFYSFPIIHDETGMLNPSEEHNRLYKTPPLFDNINFYNMSDNISNLFKQYVFSTDPFMTNHNEYWSEIDFITNNLDTLPKNSYSFLIIPTYQEEKSINETLKKYANCSKSKSIIFLILENHPKGTTRDNTFLEIQKFRKEHPSINLFHIYKIFDKRVPIGLIRKYITDIAFMLKFKNNHFENFIIIGGDADCVKIHKKFFSVIVSKFNRNKWLDAIEMKLEFPLKYQFAFPNMWVMHRFFDLCWMYKRKKFTPNKAIRMYGPSSAIKASSYLMIKGFNSRSKLCEDLELSYMLDSGRRNCTIDKKTFFDYSPVSITTNPRRALSTYLSGMNLLGMYSQFDEKDEIRSLSWEQLVNKKGKGIIRVGNTFSSEQIRNFINYKKEIIPDMGSYLSVFLQESIDWWKIKVESGWINQKQFKKMLKKVLNWLKINYICDMSDQYWTITILDVEGLHIGMNKILKQEHKKGFDTNIKEIIVEPKTYTRINKKYH